MKKKIAACLFLYWLFASDYSYGQSAGEQTNETIPLPARFFSGIQQKASNLDRQLTQQTEKYLMRIQRREQRLLSKLSKIDPVGAKKLSAGSGQYAALVQKLARDTIISHQPFSGEYHAYTDSLQGMLKFMDNLQAKGALTQVQHLEAKLQGEEEIKTYIRNRKQQMAQYLQSHADLSSLLGKDYQRLNQDVYYYSQQVRQYQEDLNDPDKLTKRALTLLNKLPAFHVFMKQNSQLAGLFNLPGNYGNTASLAGLQTRDQVSALIQQRVATGGTGGAALLQANLQSAQAQLDTYKEKLSKLGTGGGAIDMADISANDQRVRPFWRRLEYGANFQTTRNNYAFPMVSDFGLTVGYKLNRTSSVGLGASYKLGWGDGINHVAISSQGVGLRSFIEVRLKRSFSLTGGLEYNYSTPFRNMQQLQGWDDWTKSGLIGISKTVGLKSRVLKKTKLQLLWDLLSYTQVPKTQPILFRVGYGF